MDFWQFIGTIFWIYILLAYLMVLISIFRDIFSDHKLNGVLKAIWVIVLIFIPFLGAFIYVIARHKGMQERALAQAKTAQAESTDYIRSVAGSGTSIADDIAKAKSLLDSGAITPAEYDQLKAKALAAPVPA